ncbi:MAG: zinc ribbon domain-containing protein, partial [Acutalibacteraceae bacterium]|nr:zinc ribbon domain-containing protein [Acutalibacteraceae bacterium]
MKICPKCSTPNKDTAKFCNECGNELIIIEQDTQTASLNTEPVSEDTKEKSKHPEPGTPKEVSPVMNEVTDN